MGKTDGRTSPAGTCARCARSSAPLRSAPTASVPLRGAARPGGGRGPGAQRCAEQRPPPPPPLRPPPAAPPAPPAGCGFHGNRDSTCRGAATRRCALPAGEERARAHTRTHTHAHTCARTCAHARTCTHANARASAQADACTRTRARAPPRVTPAHPSQPRCVRRVFSPSATIFALQKAPRLRGCVRTGTPFGGGRGVGGCWMMHGGQLGMHTSARVGGYRFQSEAAQPHISHPLLLPYPLSTFSYVGFAAAAASDPSSVPHGVMLRLQGTTLLVSVL